jgi:hypothetical protein
VLNILLPYGPLLLIVALLLLLALTARGPDEAEAQPWWGETARLPCLLAYWGRGPSAGRRPHGGSLPGPWRDYFAGLFGDVAARIRR